MEGNALTRCVECVFWTPIDTGDNQYGTPGICDAVDITDLMDADPSLATLVEDSLGEAVALTHSTFYCRAGRRANDSH